jgi:hypothetical protein
VRGLQLRKGKLPKPNNRKIDDPLSLLGKVAINLDRMHFSVNGDVSVVMYESVCKLVGREGEGKKWLSDLAEERRYRGG